MAACDDTGDGAGPDAGAPVSTARPAIEGTGPERPAPGGNDRPAIELPSLPYGSNDDNTFLALTPTDFRTSCVHVAWLGSDIPDGVTIEVTVITIRQTARVFTRRPYACGDTECSGPRGHLTFKKKSESRCTVSVTAMDYGNARLLLGGTVRCLPAMRTACRDFASSAKEQVKPIVLRSASFSPDEAADPSTDTNPQPAS